MSTTDEINDLARDSEKAKSVHEALSWVMARVGYVQKQRSPELRYTFAGEAAIIEALREAVVLAGLTLTVESADVVERSVYTTAKGSAMQVTVARLTGRWSHWPSGTSAVVCALGEGADVGDKSTPKAMTGAYKYLLRETFLLRTGDDPDEHASEPRAAEAPRRPQEAPRPAAPAHGPAEVRRGQGGAQAAHAGAQGKGGPNQGCPDCGAQGRTPKNFDPASNRPDLYCPANCPGDEKKDGSGRWARSWWSWPKGTAPPPPQATPPGRDADIPFGGDGGDPDAWRSGPPQEW